jgi:regulation of enolase protein 1 (concanavalin A-like superfamily)
MTRSVWLLLLAPLLATAAPVPKETDKEKIEKQFGTIDDPEKDCTFALDAGKLTITMKGGKEYTWDRDEKVTNCPRLTKEVKGDFVVTAKVSAELAEKAEKAVGKWAEAGAGVIVIGDKNFARRTGMHDFRTDRRSLAITIPNLEGPGGLGLDSAGNGVWVRLTRKGEWLTAAFSLDGKKWKDTVSTGSMKDETYRVGVYGCSNSKDDTTVTVSEFGIEQPKGEKK